MLPKLIQFLRRHHRGLLVIVMLSLTAQLCCQSCDDEYILFLPERTEGVDLFTSLIADPDPARTGVPITLTYSAQLTALESRTLARSVITLQLPVGLELIQPVQPVFMPNSPACAVVASTITGLQLRSESNPCSFSVAIRAAIPGIYTPGVTLELTETQPGYGNQPHYYGTVGSLSITGGIIVTKRFDPPEVVQGQPSTMTITLTNDTAVQATGVGFEDPMPAGMTLVAVTSNTCLRSTTSTANNRLAFRGGVLAAGASCQVIATVRGDGSGLLTNTTSFISAAEFNYSNQGQANLNVILPTATPLPTNVPPAEPVKPPPVASATAATETPQ